MWKKEIIYSKHHVLPRSQWGNDNARNLTTLRDTTHRAIHTLHENRLIAEQLLRTLDFSEKAMRPEVVERLREVLTTIDPHDAKERYIPDVIV